MITYEEFSKIQIRAGTITSCEPVEGSTKLYKLIVEFGPLGTRQILTGLQAFYKPEDFVGMQTFFVFNMEPRKMMGLESQGMILAAGLDHAKKPIFIKPVEPIENGDGIS